jgi:uncharacterized protein (DUF1800 family)
MPRPDSAAASIAVTRFGLGARPGEIDAVARDPRAWLAGQIDPRGAPAPAGTFPTTTEQVAAFEAHRRAAQQTSRAERRTATGMDAPAEGASARQESRRALERGEAEEFLARVRLGATTGAGFAERWALFWANAFTASGLQFPTSHFVGVYEREAIRPNVFGRFEDLAVAAETHPAMLSYLDQAQSIGPNSRAGARRGAGLNENLAREIMELHTVGADAGYSQADVTEFARALTGWSIARPADATARNGFAFRAAAHEPGARTVMGRQYAADGYAQGERILRDLANRPETARRLSRKIAVHFVADAPPDALVDRLEAAWTGSRGGLAAVARALVEAPEAWTPQPAKVKTPYEFIISTHRALNEAPDRVAPVRRALLDLGQPMISAPSPEGWPDTAADWIGPNALVRRLNWAKTMGDASADVDAVAVASAALGPRLSDRTRQFLTRAESRAEAMTLFLMSPEFQRR